MKHAFQAFRGGLADGSVSILRLYDTRCSGTTNLETSCVGQGGDGACRRRVDRRPAGSLANTCKLV